MPKRPKTIQQRLEDAENAGWARRIRSEADEKAVSDGHWFSEAAGRHICDFFERRLRHTRGKIAGRPFGLLEWQKDAFLMPLFGWKRANGARRYAIGDVFIAKKAGKSTITAGITSYMLKTGGPRTECYGAAFTRDQASIIYREAAAMAGASPLLAPIFKPNDSRKRIVYAEKNSFYQALAGEAGAVEGLNPYFVCFDEIHVQKTRALYDALVYGDLAQEESLFLSVSTVGVADLTSIWWEQYEYAKAVLAGTITDHARFALIYQADEECKHSAKLRADPKQWQKANPSIGHTISPEKYAENISRAENSPTKINNALRYLLNIPTAAISRALDIEFWRACEAPVPLEDLEGMECFLGLDLASHEDLTALVALFPRDGVPYLKCWIWCPEERVRLREQRQMAFYRHWVDSGEVLTTEGTRIDHEAILDKVQEICETYRVTELGFDKWNADAVINPLMAEGSVEVVQVEQTHAGMSAGTKGLISAIIKGEVEHEGSQVFEWCLSNAALNTKDGAKPDEQGEFDEAAAVRFDKEKSSDKIDVAVAAAIAWGRWLVAQEAPMPGFYS